jgi:hypothetical protein
MKKLLSLLVIVVGTGACSHTSWAASSILSEIQVAPVGVYTIPNIHDKGEWGAGIEIGLKLNPNVTLSLVNISDKGEENWREGGILVDETNLKVRANLLSSENKLLTLQGIGSGNRDWNSQDWGFGVGAGVKVRLYKETLALQLDSQIRAWFKGEKDLQNTASLVWQF